MSLFSRLLDPFGRQATVKAYQQKNVALLSDIESLEAEIDRLLAINKRDHQELLRISNLANSHWDDFQAVEADRQRIAQQLADLNKRIEHEDSARVKGLQACITKLKAEAKEKDDDIANLKIDLHAAIREKNAALQGAKTQADIIKAKEDRNSHLENQLANAHENISAMSNEARITDEMAERQLTDLSEELRKQDGALREIVAFVKHWANHYQVRENHESALYQIFERLEAAEKVEAVDGE